MFQTTEMKNVQLVTICDILRIKNTFIPVRLLLNLRGGGDLFHGRNEKEEAIEE
jgi:hypothetical protein